MINLQNRDCFELMREIADGSIDMIMTDPPYFSTNLHFDDKKNKFCFENLLKECKRILKPHGVLVSFADFNLLAEMRSFNVFSSQYELIWQKTMSVGFLDANVRPLRNHEFIGVFVDGLKKATYNPQKTKGKAYVSTNKGTKIYSSNIANQTTINTGDRHPTSVLKFSNDNKDTIHANQKPLDLVEWLIKTYSNEGETVFDGFSGSGTTALACQNLNRHFIGAELHTPYFELSQKRLLNAQDLVFMANSL